LKGWGLLTRSHGKGALGEERLLGRLPKNISSLVEIVCIIAFYYRYLICILVVDVKLILVLGCSASVAQFDS